MFRRYTIIALSILAVSGSAIVILSISPSSTSAQGNGMTCHVCSRFIVLVYSNWMN